jgi:hypothetical protein
MTKNHLPRRGDCKLRCFSLDVTEHFLVVLVLLQDLLSHTVVEFFSTMETFVKDNHGWICCSPSFVNRMYPVVYTVSAISSALDSLLIALKATEGESTIQIGAVNPRQRQRDTVFDIRV